MIARFRRFCDILVFLVLTFEDELTFESKWSTPYRVFYLILSSKLPAIRLWLFDGCIIAMMYMASSQKGTKTGRVKLLDKCAWLSIASMIVWSVYGYFRGGDTVQMRLQIHTHVITMLACMCFTSVYRTPADFMRVGKIIVYAGLFRALMAFLFIQLVIRRTGIVTEYVLDHGDTILLCTVFIIMLAHAIHTRKRGVTLKALAIMGLMVWTIQVNNRRLAWVSLIFGILVVYFLSTVNSARKRLHRGIAFLIPVLTIYVAVGWGRTEKIFKPLASFQQMGGEKKDLSTESRNIENLGLAKTMETYPIMGTGFGHEYIEISDALAPKKVFPMYRYDPHNSVMGLSAFMGGIGFYCVWLVFPMISYYAARAYRWSKTPEERTIAVVAVAEVIIHANQLFGDIGINSSQTLVSIPLAFAAASRLSMSTGSMGGARPAAAPAPSAGQSGQNRVVGARTVA